MDEKGTGSRADGIKKRLSQPLDRIVVYGIFALLLLLPAISHNLYFLRLAGTIGIYIALALGLNAVTGFAGVLDLGYVAFFGIGAYTYALLGSYQLGLHLPFYIILPIVLAVGIISSLIIGVPTLRLKGDYLAIATLAFGQIFRLLLVNLDRPVNLTNGPSGIVGVDPPLGLGINMFGIVPRLYLITALALFVYVLTVKLDNSKYGRGWIAMKEDPKAASCMGINLNRYRLLALAYGAAVASVTGACFAMWQGAVFPQNFSMHELITVFCIIALGGTGSVTGAVAGAFVLVLFPELLRSYSVYRMLIYGVALVLVMRYRPQGLMPRKFKKPAKSGRQMPSYEVPAIAGGVLEVSGLKLAFGGLKALQNVSFKVCGGEVFGIIGPNGAGKTSLFNVISGLYKATSGTVALDGKTISNLSSDKVCEAGISRTFQNIRLFPDMSVEENILVGHHRRLKKGFLSTLIGTAGWKNMESEAKGHVDEVLSFIGYGMLENRYSHVAELNYADRRRVELARAVIANPRVLLLDEPGAGMTNDEISELIDRINELRQSGFTILIIEHHMQVIMNTCDRVMVLDHGQELAVGTPEEVTANQAVVEAYLGKVDEKKEGNVTFLRPRQHRKAMGRTLLELKAVKASYGHVDVLRDVDISIGEGEIVCLLGSNAAGKSTTLKTILGSLPITSGAITFDGQRIDRLPTSEIIKAGIGVVPEGRRIFACLTVEENLEMGAYSGAGSKRGPTGIEAVYAMFPILRERREQRAGTLSGGEQQMLAIGRALMSNPKLICMDEPTMGLAPIMCHKVVDIIRRINSTGTSVLIIEQNAAAVLDAADRIYLLEQGKTSLVDENAEEMGNRLRRAYLE